MPEGRGIWVGANTRPGSSRRGLTWVAPDLSATRTAEGEGAALGVSFLNSRRLLLAGGMLWLATEQGVLRINPSTFASRVWELADVTCLAPATNGVWVGTTRGLSSISADERVQTLGSSSLAVISLLAVGETLWVGTSAGLGQVTAGSDAITTPPELRDQPSMRVTVYALARLQDTIMMATERQLLWRN